MCTNTLMCINFVATMLKYFYIYLLMSEIKPSELQMTEVTELKVFLKKIPKGN